MDFIKKHPYLCSVIPAIVLGLAAGFFQLISNICAYGWEGNRLSDVLFIVMLGLMLGVFVFYPFVLTILNVFFLAGRGKNGKGFELITIGLGSIYTCLVLPLYGIQFQADWDVVLHNNETHTPIFTQSYPTIITIAVVAVIGYLVLAFIPLHKMPPLVIVCSIAAMYLGILESILWIVQLFPDVFLSLFPLNCILIAAKTVVLKIREWNEIPHEAKTYKNVFINKCNQFLCKSSHWPIVALFLMWPLLGIMICILVLFGQQPDAVIKAWTETSDWNLSNRVAPQNVYYDEHYLCTVAAGGHEKLVKPIRLGERHGHQVIVNRQLCVANAFEQILEERTPRFHKKVRHFYDTYGLPIARLIHSPYVADAIYMLMKPLEWLFLLVLYFCDVNPENRIVVQYLPKHSRKNAAG